MACQPAISMAGARLHARRTLMRKAARVEPRLNMPQRHRPGKWDRIVIDGRNCRLISDDRMGFGFRTEDSPEQEFQLTPEEYARRRRTGDIDLKRGLHEPGNARIRVALRGKPLEKIEKPKITKAKYKEDLIQLYLQAEFQANVHGRHVARSEEHLADLLANWHRQIVAKVTLAKPIRKPRAGKPTGETEGPTVRTFNNWYREYMKCGMKYTGLIDRYWGTESQAEKADTESYKLWVKFADMYLDELKPPRATLLLQLEAAIDLENETRKANGETLLVSPPDSFFKSLIDRHGEYEIMRAREGEEKARRRFEPIYRHFRHYRVGERVELDFWTVDLFAFFKVTGLLWHIKPEKRKELHDNGRLMFCGAIDVASRSILALTASYTPSSAVVLEALEMIGRDKSELALLVGAETPWYQACTPERVLFDNGSEFANNVVHDSLNRMTTTITHPKAGDPARRPFIESFFRTFGRYMLPYFDGKTFSNYLQKGDRDPQDRITLTIDELMEVAIRVVCDVYHNHPHQGLAGNSPFMAWHELSENAAPHEPPTPKEVCQIFGTEITRTVTPSGVNFMGIPYNSDALQWHFRTSPGGKDGITVRVRVHHKDLSSLVCLIDDDWKVVGNKIDIEDAIGDGPPIAYDEWRDAMKSLKEKNLLKIAGGLPRMYSTVRWLRSRAEETRIRALLPPTLVTAEQIDRDQQSYVGEAWFSKPAGDEGDIPEDDFAHAIFGGGAGREDRVGGDAAHATNMRQAPEVKAKPGSKNRKNDNGAVEVKAPKASDNAEQSSFSGRNPNDF